MSAVPALQPEEQSWADQELRSSYETFLHQNYTALLQFLQRQCFDPRLAEDALQEALIVTMHKWEIVSGHDKPLFWVRRTAWLQMLQLQRRSGWKDTVALDEGRIEVVEPASAYEVEMLLRHVLRQLPVQQRAVLALMVEGDTTEEIALQLGLAVTTVRTYKAEVRRKYKELYQGGGEEGVRA
jgi:RNA polymerase sigma factor (sigma-70 family)